MKKILALLLIFLTTLLANEFTTDENSVFDSNAQNSANSSYAEYGSSKNLYLSYLNYPKHVYKNQRFQVEVKALVTRNNYDRIETAFINGKNMTPLNPSKRWEKQEGTTDTFINKFYFKAYEKNFAMPTIEVRLYDNNNLVETRRILPQELGFSEIAKSDERFSGVIASNLTVLTSKAKQYTNKEALAIIDIEAKNSNLEDFSIKDITEQGITSIDDEYPNQHMIYYLVIPIHVKSVVFNYYNIDTNSFKKVIIPIKFEEELVSTQTDLNPNNSNFEFYKKIGVGIVALVFLLLFILRKNYLFLILFLILTILFIVFMIPNKLIKLKENTVIYILPTKNSTIFQKTTKIISVEDMKRKNGFVKIMFGSGENKYIGWVKKEDVIEN